MDSITELMLEILKVLQDEPQYAVAGRRIDQIERRHVAAAAEDERLGLQRSAARMAFMAATDKGASFKTVAKRFHARCALGFDDPFSEVALLTEFAFACADLGNRSAGLRVLRQAQERLDGSGMKPRSAFVRLQSRLIEKCRGLLEGGEGRVRL